MGLVSPSGLAYGWAARRGLRMGSVGVLGEGEARGDQRRRGRHGAMDWASGAAIDIYGYGAAYGWAATKAYFFGSFRLSIATVSTWPV